MWCQNTYVCFILLSILWMELLESQDILDNRCYLEDGVTRENFFVSEDLSVGSTVGQLRVHGDPRVGGNIALHVEETESPVRIAPGTKNLTLQHKLDKEGVEGPSSVFVNVICERLHTLEPVFVIPVTIRVSDANDNPPVFVNAPYKLNISEVTVVGTRVLQGVHAVDADQHGPFSTVRYSLLQGPYSDFFEFENQMEGTLVLRKPLDYEKLKTFDVKIRAQDLGDPPNFSDTILTVNVIDADDQNPKFYQEKYKAIIPEPPLKGTSLNIEPEAIKAYDQDLGINATIVYSFVSNEGYYNFFLIDKYTAEVRLSKNLDEKNLKYSTTLVIRATQIDNIDRYALTTLTVSRLFENAVKFLRRHFQINVSESNPPCVVIGVLATNRVGEDLKYYVSNKDILKTFSINPRGEVLLKHPLDYETQSQYTFKVFATDGITNDSSSVNITVKDDNEWEPRFRYPYYEFFVTDKNVDTIGKIEAKDGDKGDKLTLSLGGRNSSLFYITSTGELKLKRNDNELSGTANLEVIATDSARPPHKAVVPVAVHFTDRRSSDVIMGKSPINGLTLIAVLATLLFLAIVIFVLIGYILKSKRRSNQEGLLPPVDSKRCHSVDNNKPESNLVGVFESVSKKSRKNEKAVGERPRPSTKVYPAPQPPAWSRSSKPSQVKKLNWNDNAMDNDTIAEINCDLRSPKISDNMNLTVYF